jgi:short-subunit dehydrogenase
MAGSSITRNGLGNSVVAITGASSGIGRATAHAFARQGARLVLAARRAEMLDEVVEECRRAGATAMAFPVDVTDEAALRDLVDETMLSFGRIDVWVNNAGVLLFGRFDEIPPDAFRQVIETNLFGYVHGARAVLPHFLRRRRGVLINVASIAGEVGQAYSSAYVVSKYAIRGFTTALRQDLVRHPGIEICMVSPAAIDTPIWQHAANYTRKAVQAVRPTYDADEVADAIVGQALHPRREVVVGTMGKLAVLQHRLFPDRAERMFARIALRTAFKNQPTAPSAGNLFTPAGDRLKVSGGWRVARSGRGMPALAAAVALPVLLFFLARRRAGMAVAPR